METLAELVVKWLHLSAAVVWLGAVFTAPLLAMRGDAGNRGDTGSPTGRVTRSGSERRGALETPAHFYTAFTPVAWAALAILTVTGIVRAAHHLDGGVRDLVATPWGRLLCLKIVLIGVMVALGAYTRYGLVPRLERVRPARFSHFKGERQEALAGRIRALSLASAGLGLALLWVIVLL